MANLPHKSWGRTRRPKAVSSVGASTPVYDTLETARAVTVSAVGNLSADLSSATEGRNGYATENQRFLHVTTSAANGKSAKIYVYNYAVQIWAPLMIRDGEGDPITYTAATVSTVGSATASAQPQHYIFEIAGCDRVAFVSTDAPTLHACCTTF